MEIRAARLIVGSPGGTASKGANTYKVCLPSAWVREMGLSKSGREILLSFDGSRIVLSRRLSFREFREAAKAQGHRLYHLSLREGDILRGEILADYTAETVCVQNHTTDFLKTPFGNNPAPTWEDYQEFLESRCVPRSRAGLREYLEALGLDRYDPLEIIQKTQGRMAEDRLWVQVEAVL